MQNCTVPIKIFEHSFMQKTATNNIKIKGSLISEIYEPEEGGMRAYNLGSDTNPWNNIYYNEGKAGLVYTESGSVTGSDRDTKNSIKSISDSYGFIFDALKPVTFKYNNGASNRLHAGFIAQEVRDATLKAGLSTQDFAAYCEWENGDGTIGCGLRYSEFIALCVDQIQKLKSRVAELENKLLTQQND